MPKSKIKEKNLEEKKDELLQSQNLQENISVSLNTSKKKKKKKKKKNKKIVIQPQREMIQYLNYLTEWKESRDTWKFKKSNFKNPITTYLT